MRCFLVMLILMASDSLAKPAQKVESTLIENEPKGLYTHNDLVEMAQPRVRIGLRLTPYGKTVVKDSKGIPQESYVAREPIRHTLRARLNKVNHFYMGEWHVETSPKHMIKQTKGYVVTLRIYRRYGAFGQLEEHVGSVDLAGTLDPQSDTIYVLNGIARQRLRDKFGFPYLDVVAGYSPSGNDAQNTPPTPIQSAPAKTI